MSSGTESVSLYQSAAKIHPRRVDGRYARLRILAAVVLLGLYYGLPWIEVSGTPLVWFDLPHRRFHLFTLVFAPQDLIYLTGLLLGAALTLFFFTALVGRVWCGYACPQTVWTEAFLWIEHLAEGDRHARMKLDRSAWNAKKILRRGGKHLLWLVFALFTGLTFVAYFVPARELFPAALSLDLSGWPLFWALFYGFATWGNAGFMREQVCKYMCPYARFQSAMFDRDTLVVAYDEKRGEPRKSLARKQGVEAADCIDCSLCVQVCPTGIDIRQGLQYECIACAACVDACNGVMDSVDKPRGLIHYTSSNADAGRPFRLLRPRTIGYGLAWLLVLAGFGAALAMRTPLEFDVIRDRHSLYRALPDGAVENIYVVKLANQDADAHVLDLSVDEPGSAVEYDAEPSRFRLDAGESKAVTVSVRTQPGQRPEGMRHRLRFRLEAQGNSGVRREREASFIAGDDR